VGFFEPSKGDSKDNIADYIAPPFTLVFAQKAGGPKSGILKSTHTLKRKREGDVHNVITNMYNMGGENRIPVKDLRCIGVAYDGVLDGKGAKNHPDKIGRLAVIVSGAVTILCNKDDLKDLSVGDMLEWHMEDNGQIYNGLPRDWSTARISKAHGGKGITAIDTPYESMFGVKKLYTDADETELIQRLATIRSFNRASPLEAYNLEGITPYAAAEALAHIMFAAQGVYLETTDAWVDKLYNPTSKYYIMEAQPEEGSIKWIQHCMGDLNNLNVIINNDGHTKKTWLTFGTTIDSSTVPQAVGWWNHECKGIRKTDSATNKKLADIWAMKTEPKKFDDDYFLYKAVHGKDFDSHDLAAMTLGADIDPTSVQEVADFIGPFYKGGRTHSRMHWMAFARSDIIGAYNIKSFVASVHYRCLDAGKTGFDFLNTGSVISTTVVGNPNTVADKVVIALNANPTTPTPANQKKYMEHALGMHHDGGSSNVFGMLLEKNPRANEARILLCPGTCM